jgi:hypothetical protein
VIRDTGKVQFEDQRQVIDGRDQRDIYTANGEDAARILVIKAEEPALIRFNGVSDQNFDIGSRIRFQLPSDAFAHTSANAVVRIAVERLDGGQWPSWLVFNPTTGVFEGVVPLGVDREFGVKVTARDAEVREASTIFKIRFEDQRQTVDGRVLGDIYTSNGDGALRIAVVKAEEPSLVRLNGVPDQNYDMGTHIRFQLPADAFAHSRENAVVRITVERLDGEQWPSWLVFNPTTGVFEGDVPVGSPSEMGVRVIARDAEGREATTIFKIKLMTGEKVQKLTRSSLSDQIRQFSSRPTHLEKLANLDKTSRQADLRRAA